MTENNIIRGKVYVLGDDIDTDQIIPAGYLNLVPTIPEEYKKLGSYALAGLHFIYHVSKMVYPSHNEILQKLQE